MTLELALVILVILIVWMAQHLIGVPPMKTEPVRLFGYTATGLALLAIGVATAALRSATWKEGVLAALAALAAGLGGTETLRGQVVAPATHAAIVTAVARNKGAPSAGKPPTG